MNCHENQRLLDDYLDGELPEEARRQVERHLASCADCRSEVEGLAALIRAAHELDREIRPRRDLWPGIATRLRSSRPAETSRWLLRLAAVLAILVLCVPLSVWWTGRGQVDNRVEAVVPPSQPVAAALARSEDGMLLARADLVTAIEERRDVVEDETLFLLEENMNLLDQAIGEIRLALEEDPYNLRLRMLLAARYQQERKLLQQISRV